MEKPVYTISSYDNGLLHFFESVGEGSTTKKVIAFSPSNENKMIYRLVFGDLSPDGNIDVFSSSSNSDMKMILATVIKAVTTFFEYHTDKVISFIGSTPARTRLYRAVITKFIDDPELSYEIYGFTPEDVIELFEKNKHYIGYLIRKK